MTNLKDKLTYEIPKYFFFRIQVTFLHSCVYMSITKTHTPINIYSQINI